MKAKKSLGQNFLKSQKIIEKIIDAGEIKNTDTILEIGPGMGNLTEKLLEKASVVAIEKDKKLFEFLQEKFILKGRASQGGPALKSIGKGLKLINDDILKFNTETLQDYKIIANIPYNITGAILKKFLIAKNQPKMMVLMVQYEVAKRIMGISLGANKGKPKNEKESLLSISVKAYGNPKFIQKVKAGNFYPKPKVDSAILVIKNISRDKFTTRPGLVVNENEFWEIVHLGFAHKRKKLFSNLKKSYNINLDIIKVRGISANARAEDLSLDDWFKIVDLKDSVGPFKSVKEAIEYLKS